MAGTSSISDLIGCVERRSDGRGEWGGAHRGETAEDGARGGRSCCRRCVAMLQGVLGSGKATGGRSARQRMRGWRWRLRGKLQSTARHERGRSERRRASVRSARSIHCAIEQGRSEGRCARLQGVQGRGTRVQARPYLVGISETQRRLGLSSGVRLRQPGGAIRRGNMGQRERGSQAL